MKIALDYGTTGLEVEVPADRTTIITPEHHDGLPDPRSALREALRVPIGCRPLREIVAPGDTVAISVCDITRPQPRREMLEAIFDALPQTRPEDVVIVIATGTHRANTPEELDAMLGPEIASRYPIVNHDARDTGSLMRLPDPNPGVPLLLNRRWLEADVRITTGFVEPHLFAGFSGGPKLVAPGLAGLETILVLHDAARIRHPKAIWGVIEGNPIQRDIRAIARAVGVHFTLDVVLNRDQEITGVFGGEIFKAHAKACERAKRDAMRPVPAPFDVVLTTNSGYPLDQNLYQAVKGMRAADPIVQHGGTIILAAECREGLPEHGSYAELLRSRPSPEALLDMIDADGFHAPDQWQVQVQALVQRRATIYLKSDGLTAQQLAESHLLPADDVSETIDRTLAEAGDRARLCVLPQGPQTIPYLV